MAGSVHAVRVDVPAELPGGEPDAGVAVVAGVQGPRGRRGQVADVAAAQGLAGRPGAGRDSRRDKRRRQQRGRRQPERQRRKRGRPERRRRPWRVRCRVRAATPGFRGAGRVEAVPDPGGLLPVAGGQRRVRDTVLRGELLPGGRLHAGLQRGLHRGGRAAARHERHRVRVHTAHEPPHHGHDVGRVDGRVHGGVRRVRVGVRGAPGGRPAVQLGTVGVHPVQRERQHAGHGAAAVDDDRRDVPAPGARHHGRPGPFAGIFFHIHHSQGDARSHDRPANRPDHVAVRRRGRCSRVLRVRVLARDPRQESATNRKVLRRLRVHRQEIQTQGPRVLHQLHSGRVPQMTRRALAGFSFPFAAIRTRPLEKPARARLFVARGLF